MTPSLLTILTKKLDSHHSRKHERNMHPQRKTNEKGKERKKKKGKEKERERKKEEWFSLHGYHGYGGHGPNV